MTLDVPLQQGLTALGLALPESAQAQLLAYLTLLKKWNATYNLTSIREESAMLTQHLFDSLSILPHLEKSALATRRWADVGSGAGLPGIPLAIACPQLQMTLIDSVDKKTAFQRQVKIELELSNLTVMGGRVENHPAARCDAVISRAFAELADFVSLAGHLLVEGGTLYAMKGQMPQDEISRLPVGWHVTQCLPLQVPGMAAERHLIVLQKDH
ncbi:16S rRNA methyltransferase [Rugosibacter aromaticivorans]|uniref:Ribosomal RNA small subunit methyltransferase G n=1 Tax=Rugosibacter aromaticivorans TaxID=1565605 RepID=A0A0C5JPT2_9PROT|nr:16S rRNA (guanine(527)-N(7))-methyltransferase RsmG [Rugosibacter aromaticivorans]AJP49291.1 16S rRNA methyltransferase [Rugosibacter aromaticivorans]TBR16534.1 MAG: 16S rRNA (guanine(527)-N(7))-methyltransferase RsmG [Rugosibacter sp.]